MSLRISKQKYFVVLSGESSQTIPDISVDNIGDLNTNGPSLIYATLYDNNGKLYITGQFNQITYRGTTLPVNNIAMFDGINWYDLNGGINGSGLCLAKDSNNNIIVGGQFTDVGNNIARWEGSLWNNLNGGANGTVESLFFDNVQNMLYVGGQFSAVSTPPVSTDKFARYSYNNNTWQSINALSGLGNIYSIDKFPNGDIVIGGIFSSIGPNNVNVNNIARWDGSNWFDVSGGVNSSVRKVYVDNNDLYVGGSFTTVSNNNIPINKLALFRNNIWQSIGGSIASTGGGVSVFDINKIDNNLYISGAFTQIGNAPEIVNANAFAKWDGTSWSNVLGGIVGTVVTSIDPSPANTKIALGGIYTSNNGIPTINISTISLSSISKTYSSFIISKSNTKKIN